MISLDVETYLRARDSEYSAGYVATVVGYERPITIDYVNVPLDFFEGMEGEGEITCIRPGEYEEHFRTQATLSAVISSYYPHAKRGSSEIIRLEKTPEAYLVRPKPEITFLPHQALARVSNLMVTNSIGETVESHRGFVKRLLSLTEYGPRLIGTVEITGRQLDDNIIPLPR